MSAMADKELEELVGYLSQNAGSNYDDWLVVKFIYLKLWKNVAPQIVSSVPIPIPRAPTKSISWESED